MNYKYILKIQNGGKPVPLFVYNNLINTRSPKQTAGRVTPFCVTHWSSVDRTMLLSFFNSESLNITHCNFKLFVTTVLYFLPCRPHVLSEND